jgi:membrane fusion protein, copper/silver efflux system
VRGATTGSLVKRNEALLSFYAPEFLNAQLSYFSGLDTLRVANQDAVERFANTLRNLGVSEKQLDDIRTNRRINQYINIVSPVDGFVLDRKASVGLRCDRGFEFYRIADLRRVWVLADVYENQAPFIRAGSMARVTSQSRQFEATVSRTEPIFDEATRTLKVRLETDNPGFALKPGMFVDVQFDIELPPSLAVPAEAIVDSGLRKTIFVDRGHGYFEPRSVETGWRIADQVEISKGLMAGERIVISGTFLIDSESRMKAASRGIFGQAARDPICGMEVDEKRAAAAGRSSEYQGANYYFCADECKKRFDAEPARYTQAR